MFWESRKRQGENRTQERTKTHKITCIAFSSTSNLSWDLNDPTIQQTQLHHWGFELFQRNSDTELTGTHSLCSENKGEIQLSVCVAAEGGKNQIWCKTTTYLTGLTV